MSQWSLNAKLMGVWDELSKKEVISLIGAGSFMVAAFLGFRFYNNSRGASMLKIHQLHETVQKCLQKAAINRQSLLVQQTHTVESKNITMQFILVSKLKQKERENDELVRNPFLPPFQEGLFIKELGQHHRLLFNKFNLYENHLIVVTKQFEPQSNPLTKIDFKPIILAFRAMRGFYFFNSGPQAGASQIHKHIQIFPFEAKDLPIFRMILEFCREEKYQISQRNENSGLNPEQLSVIQFPPFNFRHGIILLGQLQDQSSQNDKPKNSNNQAIHQLKEKSFKAFQKLYQHLLPQQDQKTDYNLIGCQHFLMMIPRRKQKAFNDLSVNAIGFMGSVLFKDKNLLRKYINQQRQGYQILEDITFPKKI